MGRHWFSVVTLACIAACGGQSVYTQGGEAGAGDGGNGASGGNGTGGRGGDTGGSTTGGSSTGGATGGSSPGGVGGAGTGGSVSTGGVGVGGSVVTGGTSGKGGSGGTGGTGVVCPPGYSLCGNRCVDVFSDPSACGACGNVCSPDAICNQGSCQVRCPPDLWTCADACVDLGSDPNNCGECGLVCTDGARCNGGTCTVACGGTLADCGESCADLTSDPAHCGGCFNACATDQVCDQGRCVGSSATYHWKLVTNTACNAWCGQGPSPFDTCSGPWLCNSSYVGGYIWVYRGGPMPPPNPASQSSSGYGWAHWWCDESTCGGPGPIQQSCGGEPAENAIYQCVYE